MSTVAFLFEQVYYEENLIIGGEETEGVSSSSSRFQVF